jgi:hypothetical protein
MVFHKVPYCLLPYTISSQPIRPRTTRVKLPHLRMILRSLCPAEILEWFAIYCNDTSTPFPRTPSSGEDKNKRGQNPGDIFHSMLFSADCSNQGWGPSKITKVNFQMNFVGGSSSFPLPPKARTKKIA